MPIGFYFDDIERAAFGLTAENYEDEVHPFDIKPISVIHDDAEDTDDDSCIGGMHGEFREKERC